MVNRFHIRLDYRPAFDLWLVFSFGYPSVWSMYPRWIFSWRASPGNLRWDNGPAAFLGYQEHPLEIAIMGGAWPYQRTVWLHAPGSCVSGDSCQMKGNFM